MPFKENSHMLSSRHKFQRCISFSCKNLSKITSQSNSKFHILPARVSVLPLSKSKGFLNTAFQIPNLLSTATSSRAWWYISELGWNSLFTSLSNHGQTWWSQRGRRSPRRTEIWMRWKSCGRNSTSHTIAIEPEANCSGVAC